MSPSAKENGDASVANGDGHASATNTNGHANVATGDGPASAPEAKEQLPANGVSAIVVGSGIGGLSAARELWRIGCSVRVLERRPQEILTGKSWVNDARQRAPPAVRGHY